MSLSDFIGKKQREIQTKGPYYAVKTGMAEATLKALNPVMDRFTTPIWASDADIILVLDSCRWDLWQETIEDYPIPTGDPIYSVGSASPTWISKTFAPAYKNHWQNVGYVTGNAFTGKQPDNHRRADVFPLRERDLAYLDEAWLVEWDTGDMDMVEPDVLTDRGMWVWDNRDELNIDRLVIHYMQPHVPFRSKTEWNDGWEDQYNFGTEDVPEKQSEWHKLRDGLIDEGAFWWAYKDNLKYVLGEVQRWLETTDATFLLTSDHGNAMGEYGEWGHPPSVANPVVRKVPFATVDGVELRERSYELENTPPALSTQSGVSEIDDQLAALGYR